MLFAKAVYASGTPLSLFENPAWDEFFARLRPSFNVPSKYDLSGSLLDDVYNDLKVKMKKKVEDSETLGISIDGWTNVRRESIMNCMLYTPEPVFEKSIECGLESHTGDYIAEQLQTVIEEKGPQKVMGAVTNTPNNMKAAGNILQNKYPWLTWYGCLMHLLNLLLVAICTKVPRVSEVIDLSNAITKEILGKPKELALFRDHQKKKIHILENPGQDSIYLRNELLNDHLWEKLDEVLEIVRPIEEWLFNVQSNDMPFNQFLIAFKDISSKISAVLEKSDFLEDDEKETIRQILTDRKKKALKPIHCAAALLDPSLCNTLTPDEQSEAVDYLSTILIDLNLDLTKVLEEPSWKKMDLQPHVWWKAFFSTSELGKIAVKILCLPLTAAAVERSFSAHGRIHSKIRNRLLNKRAEKLVFIHRNLKLLEPKKMKKKAESTTTNEEQGKIDFQDVDFESLEVLRDVSDDLGFFFNSLSKPDATIIIIDSDKPSTSNADNEEDPDECEFELPDIGPDP
ncbi:uncharacterized protein [Bemisia tabaci]|uniref:uncharacterized protein n=1 Tax=Bemisia tabaci TaxID=7038 RepID=UPI003B27C521